MTPSSTKGVLALLRVGIEGFITQLEDSQEALHNHLLRRLHQFTKALDLDESFSDGLLAHPSISFPIFLALLGFLPFFLNFL